MDGRDVYEFAFFTEFGYDADPINALGGIRFTENELFGSNFSARGTLVYKLDPTNSIKFIISQAYRSPSLFEFYFETTARTVQGNTELDPETAVSYEVAYVSAFENLFFQVLAYYAEYEDKIFRRSTTLADGSSTNKYFNGDSFDAFGGEIEARYLNPELVDLFINYSIVEGGDGDEFEGNDNYNFKYVPQSTLAVGLSKEMSGVFTSLVMNYQTDAEGPVGDVDDGFVFDAQIGYNQKLDSGARVRHAIIATNLFDEELEVAEYVRRGSINDLPSGFGRRVIYQASFTF
jgi:outer membrane receptor for ferrienterochelin and colicins